MGRNHFKYNLDHAVKYNFHVIKTLVYEKTFLINNKSTVFDKELLNTHNNL
ncbi:hypothetical protein GCM10027284_38300 [Cyclobacterium sediminis]